MANQKPLIVQVNHKQLQILSPKGRGKVLVSEQTRSLRTRPIVKWAGGKRWLAVAAHLFTSKKFDGRYFEPLVGGGAFFFALEPSKAILGDLNADLVATYQAIRDDAETVIKLLSKYPYSKSFYYQIRGSTPQSMAKRAARFLYLNRVCWNGLCRVNQQGKFDTPFGKYNNPTICDRDRLRSAAKLLKRATIRHADFRRTLKDVRAGDFVYLDPPYVTGHLNNGFLKYNARLFSWEDQELLAQWAVRLAKLGAHVLVSNADHSAVIRLYPDFHYYRVARHSLISGVVRSRGIVTEALLSSYPLLGCNSKVI
jgi:DNA adenine methylase